MAFVLGGGIGITGAADIVVAADAPPSPCPKDRGAMGGGAHLQRMFGVQKVRYLFFTGEKIGACGRLRYGRIERMVPKRRAVARRGDGRSPARSPPRARR